MTVPNIILISLDSLRADHLSINGYPRTTSPTLSEILQDERSTFFENCFTTTAWTLPAHASVFTGLYPSEHGVFDGDLKIDPEITFPQKLTDAGYQTEAFLNNGWLTKSGVTDGFNERTNIFEMDTPSNIVTKNLNRINMLLSRTDDGAKKTIANFKRRYSTVSQPFFAFLHLMEPHYLYNPVRPYHRSYNTQSTMRLLLKQRNIYTQRGKYYDGQVTVKESDLDGFVDLYDGEIKYVDAQLKNLMSILKTMGEFKNTMVVIFGDHGELFGEDGLIGHHFSLADTLLHVPLLVKWPQRYHPITESRVSSYVELSDLFGTILKAAGLDDAVNNERTLKSKCADNSKTAYAEYKAPASLVESFKTQTRDGTFPAHLRTNIKALRHGKYKLTVTDEEIALFNIESDPNEGTDVSREKPDVVTDLRERMNDYIGNGQTKASNSTTAFSEDVEKQLKDLGYI